jgi:hypothetical protein
MRPVRDKSCFSSPFLSTTCCAVMSPVANRTAVVMLCVSSGRAASLAWYLPIMMSLIFQNGKNTNEEEKGPKKKIKNRGARFGSFMVYRDKILTNEAWRRLIVQVPLSQSCF